MSLVRSRVSVQEPQQLLTPSRVVERMCRSYAHILGNGCMLDLGCGNGRNLRPFAAIGMQVVGLDMNPAATSSANELFGKFHIPGCVVRARMERMPFTTGTFRGILSSGVIYLVPASRLMQTFQEISRTLEQDGLFLYSEGCYHDLRHTGTPRVNDITQDGLEALTGSVGLRTIFLEETSTPAGNNHRFHGINAVFRK